MTIGLIGGEGFVGSGIKRAMEKEGFSVTVIERNTYQQFVGSSFDIIVNANGNSKKYLASQSPKEEFNLSVATVQQSLVDFSYDFYIHCSTIDVYPDHEHPEFNTENALIDQHKLSLYGIHKHIAEQLVQRYAKQWLVLRFGGFIGPGLKKNSIFDILHNVPLRVDADSDYQYLPTDSAGAIILQLLNSRVRNEIVNVCGQGCIRLRDIIGHVPEYRLQYGVENPPKEHYEVNIFKVLKHASVPKTRDSVLEFIRTFREH